MGGGRGLPRRSSRWRLRHPRRLRSEPCWCRRRARPRCSGPHHRRSTAGRTDVADPEDAGLGGGVDSARVVPPGGRNMLTASTAGSSVGARPGNSASDAGSRQMVRCPKVTRRRRRSIIRRPRLAEVLELRGPQPARMVGRDRDLASCCSVEHPDVPDRWRSPSPGHAGHPIRTDRRSIDLAAGRRHPQLSGDLLVLVEHHRRWPVTRPQRCDPTGTPGRSLRAVPGVGESCSR